MSGGNKVVGLWRDKEVAPHQVDDLGDVHVAAMPSYEAPEDEWEEAPPPGRTREILGKAVAVTAALGWTGTVAWERYLVLGTATPGLADITSFITTVSAPLALIGVLWVLFQRSGKAEQRRFARVSTMIETESERLNSLFALINTRIGDSRAELDKQAERLMSLGEDASARLNSITRAMDGEIETVTRHAQQLTGSAAAARGDLAVLLSSLPKANVQTRQMISSLQEAGLAAHEHAGALDAQLGLLAVRGKEADEIAGSAAQKLAAHLARMESVGEVAGARLEMAAGQMTEAVDAALDRAGQALDTARQGMEAQGSAMMALVEQSQAAMARAGDEAATTLKDRIGEIGLRIEEVASTFSSQDERASALVARLKGDLETIESRFADFDTAGSERIERLGMSIKALRDHSVDMTNALSGSGDTANQLIERVQSLLTALDATQKEVDETLPAAFTRLEGAANQAMAIVERASPAIGEVSGLATASLGQLEGMAAAVAKQRADLEAMADVGSERLTECKNAADQLALQIAQANNDAARLAEEAVPTLRQALDAVRASSEEAGRQTRSALENAVSGATDMLGARTRDALSDALTRQVESQMTAIAATTEQAVAAAQKATDRLMRQMLTISETTAGLEARVAEAKADVERSDQGNFARRVALLIESLNSTSIDVTKILSNEITDTAWASYLRGDRGVFSRRAVRLLDSAQVKEITLHYEHEPEFREQVNRYIHDFESMLRNVLSTRDGNMLGVTLLSSDNGKLYVALAQAIERLRT